MRCVRQVAWAFASAALLLTSSACAVPLDLHRRHLVSAGLGAATLQPNAGLDPAARVGMLEFGHSFSAQTTYSRRLTPPSPYYAISASAFGQVVSGGDVTGPQLAHPADLHWSAAGPTLRAQGRMRKDHPVSFAIDAGVALVHLSRRDRDGRVSAATTGSPAIGAAIEFGLTPRVGWCVSGRWVRIPLDKVGLTETPQWAGAGALSVLVGF